MADSSPPIPTPQETPDEDLAELGPNDILIAVMGITGSGKSTFISLLADGEAEIGHSLTSMTAEVRLHAFAYKDTRKVYLIDTPGFDDTNKTDTDILKQVAHYLSMTYRKNVRLSGIIYLHRITDVRMSGSSLKNLSMFKKLCGEDAYKHVALATTMWGNLKGANLSLDTGEAREKELVSRADWWGLMKERGSQVIRHDGTKECAMNIIGSLIERRDANGPVQLSIQKEMVDDNKSLENTAAGQEVNKELTILREKLQEQISELKEGYNDALKDQDTKLAAMLLEQSEAVEKRMAAASAAQEELKVSFQRLHEEQKEIWVQEQVRMQAEQERREAELAETKANTERLEREREEAGERHRIEREEMDLKRQEAEVRFQQALKQQKTEEAQRAKQDKIELERRQRQFEERFAWERRQHEQQMQAQMQHMAQLQQAKPEKASSTMPLVSMLGGVVTAGLGLMTMNIPALASGVSTFVDGMTQM
ncbi:hypothetical protein B0A48_01173 [Cryoendolithus antarcticus]|uniref:G domain-containing protein n=1 Tax=Cryoendolithus antarcticus TaxID=1507870 RepID=A0A1V8TSK9_9PEZI|nr:hypothetical protein B0A48_01173 [Cryoendolithus antarcticus]